MSSTEKDMLENMTSLNGSDQFLTTEENKPLMPTQSTHSTFLRDTSDINCDVYNDLREHFSSLVGYFSDDKFEDDAVSESFGNDLREQIVDRLDSTETVTRTKHISISDDKSRFSPSFVWDESFLPSKGFSRSSEFSSGCGEDTRARIHAYINDPANARFKRILDACVTSLLARMPSDPLYFMAHQMVRMNICDVDDMGGNVCKTCLDATGNSMEAVEVDLKNWLHIAIKKNLQESGKLDLDVKKWLLSSMPKHFPGDFGMNERDFKKLLLSGIQEYFPEHHNMTNGGDVLKWLEQLPNDNNSGKC